MTSENPPENVEFVKVCEKNGYCVMKIQTSDIESPTKKPQHKSPEDSQVSVVKSPIPSLISRKHISKRNHTKKSKSGVVCKEISLTTNIEDSL